jgi:HEPN domain-containing protein
MKEVKKWMEKAEHDLNTARINLQQKIYDASAFFCQQAVEKALKALYIKKFRRLFKTHDLYLLGKRLDLPKELLEVCDEISSLYVETRYPDSYAEFNKEKVSKTIQKAKEVIKWVKKKI